jgi:hypothetical protein
MGLSLTETFIREHRESISCCFIEAGRAGVRLPSAVQLPPLSGAPDAPVAQANGQPMLVRQNPLPADPSTNGAVPEPPADAPGEFICVMTSDPEEPPTNGHAPPTVVPKGGGLPCAGVAIADLKPAQLAMLVSKVARLVHDEGERWVPLLAALQAERARRLERGRKPTGPGSEEKG